MFNTPVIGLDIGRSAVKVVAVHNGLFTRLIFPSAVCPAIEIGIKDVAERAALETVTVGGHDYFTGETAAIQGGLDNSLGLSDDWTDTTPYLALVASAMKRLAQRGIPNLDKAYLVVGTPSKLYKSTKDALARRTLEAVGHEVTIRVLPQPMGAFSSFALDTKGAAIPARHRDETGAARSWATIEVGHFTTDFLLMRKGTYVETAAISCDGIYVAINDLVRRLASKGMTVTPIQAEEILRTKTVKHFGQMKDVTAEVNAAIETCAEKIQIAASTLLSKEASSLDGVLLAGGGGQFILAPLAKKWPNALLVDEPRMAVADGYCRFGIGAIAKRAMTEKAAAQA